MVVSFTKDEFVLSASKRVPVNGDGMQEDVRVSSLRLPGRRSVEIPDGQLGRIGGDGVEGSRLAAQVLSRPVDPDVHRQHSVDGSLQLAIPIHHRRVRLNVEARHGRRRQLPRDVVLFISFIFCIFFCLLYVCMYLIHREITVSTEDERVRD